MRALHQRLASCLAPCLALGSVFFASTALADSDSLLTLGVGAQYTLTAPSVADTESQISGSQYGVVSRMKVLRFLGFEGTAQFDQDPKTQGERLLSPRYQLGLMVNLVPTSNFNLFLVGGLAAHNGGDLFNLDGRSTSFHAGPGFEVFIGDHVALGADVRFRVPGPSYIKEQVKDALSPQPVEDALGLNVWQANLTVSYYL